MLKFYTSEFQDIDFLQNKNFPKLLTKDALCCIFAVLILNREDMEYTNPIQEARRYVTNAEEVIQKAKYDPETKSYLDSKYVKTAGNILWNGCLIALEALLNVRKGKGRPSIEKYKEAAAKRDGTLLKFINAGYETMHLYMGYDGTSNKKVCDAGFEAANAIISRCATMMPAPVCA